MAAAAERMKLYVEITFISIKFKPFLAREEIVKRNGITPKS